ncbi:CHAT domain-containing protein [Leptolyngbya sp. FACHB-671]|uniref:CHAT domain-containing tetratricopeptide repeat protein n=1 Tax=Leptolyngbya sp. FACHB-671 TaxID=2692812 RepID=UPI001687EB77|nr:CHAT domain-containing tetratricopeptide repeat protein [Leptolyngbya sp. FACHB-671]MBD2072115.1 CHAT domain-containing protein [Leptolyngbya sp. FACHB-671]
MSKFRLTVSLVILCSVFFPQSTIAQNIWGASSNSTYAQAASATVNALDAVVEGRTLAARGRLNEAIAAYRRAIQIDPNLAVAHNNLGIVLARRGRLQEAADAYREAIRLDPNLANAYNNLAEVLQDLGQPQEAEQAQAQASAVLNSASSTNVVDYINLGRALGNQGKHEEAIAAYEIALELNPTLGTTYNNLGNSLRSLERLEEATEAYRRAIELTPTLVVAYNNLGFVLTQLGRPEEAREVYDRVNAIDPRLIALREPDNATAEDYNTLGRVLRSQNRREEAITAYTRAIELNNQLAAAYNNRGVAYAELEQIDAAIEDYRVATFLDPTPTQYVNLGNALRARGRLDEAIAAYLNIESVFNLIEQLPTRVNNQDLLTALISNQNNFEFYRDRASFFAENQSYYASYINILMQLHRERPDGDIRFDALALETSERARARSLLEILTGAEAYQNVGDAELVEEERRLRRQFERLEADWEQLRTEQQTLNSLRQLSIESPSEVAGSTEVIEAEAIANPVDSTTGDVSSLTDEPGIDITAVLTQALAAQIQLDQRQSRLDQQQVELEHQIDQILTQYKTVQEQIRASNPDYAEITQPKALSVQDIQTQILDDDTLLLEYWLGEERSYLWLVSNTGVQTYELPGREAIDVAARRFYNFLTVPSERVKAVRTAQAGMELSRMILGPAADQLKDKRLLVVADGSLHYIPFSAIPIPQAESIPVDPEDLPEPLIVNHEIVNLPSASALAIIRERLGDRPPASRQLAVIADPVFNLKDPRFLEPAVGQATVPTPATRTASSPPTEAFARLLGTSQEASEIIEIAEDEGEDFLSLTGFEANRERVLNEELSQYRILHFATHGLLNDRSPGESGLVLSQYDEQINPLEGDNFFSLTDVFGLRLSAELVVLSGCRTGLGADLRGEGLVGLTRGFMYAGAERVLVSLWSVDDEATAALMSRFYDELIDQNNSPAEALRAAQLQLLQDRDSTWQTPYYWAAFTLQGEWR